MTKTETPRYVMFAFKRMTDERRRATDVFEGNMQKWRAQLDGGKLDPAEFASWAHYEAMTLLEALEASQRRCDDDIEQARAADAAWAARVAAAERAQAQTPDTGPALRGAGGFGSTGE